MPDVPSAFDPGSSPRSRLPIVLAAGTISNPAHWSHGVTDRLPVSPLHRYSISPKGTERELRRCGFALPNHFLAMHHVISEHVRLAPVELLILIATTTGNVQRAVQAEALPETFRGSKTLPPDMVVPMSRRGIARATGLPTETVRRHVAAMVARGVLVSTPKGVQAPNRMGERWVAGAMARLLASHVACTEQLVALQALVPRSPAARKSKRE